MQRQVGELAFGEGHHVDRLTMQIFTNPCADKASAGQKKTL
jgi:hypothetical protein